MSGYNAFLMNSTLNNGLPDQFSVLRINPETQPFQQRSLDAFLDEKILSPNDPVAQNEELGWTYDMYISKENLQRVSRPVLKNHRKKNSFQNTTKGYQNASGAGVYENHHRTKNEKQRPRNVRIAGSPPSGADYNRFSRTNSSHRPNTERAQLMNREFEPQQLADAEGVLNTVVFIKGLKYTVNRKEIYNYFSSCGNIIDVELPMCRRRRGRSRGICWITYEHPSSVNEALSLNGTFFQEREVRVFVAKSARAQNNGNRTTLFVWGLPPQIRDLDMGKKENTRRQLEALFLFAGEIKSIRIPKPSIRGPIAFIEFFEPDDAATGLSIDGRMFHGSAIRVEFARNAR